MTDVEAVRTALLALHRELLAEQRIDRERFTGRMSGGEALQAAIEDPRFSWLRSLSEVLTLLDEAEDDVERDAVLVRLRALVDPPDETTSFGRTYLRSLQRHPGVVLAHRDLTAALAQ